MSMTKKIKIRLYRPHPGQMELHRSEARFRVAACGRRWGKTVAATTEIAKHAWVKPNSVCFWVAPVYSQSMIAFDLIKKGFPRRGVIGINKTERRVTLKNRSIIEFKSAEIPQNLRGFGMDFLVVDEAAYLSKKVWEEVLRPALADRLGKALIVGTPRGKNWFFHLFSRGRDREAKNWESFTFPTANNPQIAEEEIMEARRTLPDQVFNQEYMAQFIEDAGALFSGLGDIIRSSLVDPIPGKTYHAGLDIARYRDYTVLTILDENGFLIAFDRFHRMSWKMMKNRVVSTLNKYNNAVVWVDSTGVGDPFLEGLIRKGARARGFKFTNDSKARLIENLALGIWEGKILIAPITELIDELMMFEATMTSSGNIRYSAPEGYFDDCVISLALAWWGMRGWRVRQSDFERVGF